MHLVQKRKTAIHHTDHLCQGVKLGVTAVKEKSLAVIYPSLQLHAVKKKSPAVIYPSLQLHKVPVPGNSKTSDSPVKILLFLSCLCDSLFSFVWFGFDLLKQM